MALAAVDSGELRTRPFEDGCGRVRISPKHLGEAVGVVEADERVGDDEPALGSSGPGVGNGTVGSSVAAWSYAR